MLLFGKLFQRVESTSSSEQSSEEAKKGMDPKFYFTPKEGQFGLYTLTVKFRYHRFPITYDFHMEPIPSPQEYLRDHVIKPLLWATSRLNRQLETLKEHAKTKLDFSLLDPNARDLKHSTRNAYAPLRGFGSSLLEAYFKWQLDPSGARNNEISAPLAGDADSQPLSSSQPIERNFQGATTHGGASRARTKANSGKETWNMDSLRLDSHNPLIMDLRYESTVNGGATGGAGDGENGSSFSFAPGDASGAYGDASSSSSQAINGHTSHHHRNNSPSLPAGSQIYDPEIVKQEEEERAAAMAERLAKKKRRREEQEMLQQQLKQKGTAPAATGKKRAKFV